MPAEGSINQAIRPPSKVTYPFSAIVGQDEMKLGLMIAATDPRIGGVLIFGDRGTGKSTAVRGLAGLLPRIPMVDGCRYNCAPAARAGLCERCDGTGAASKERQAVIPVVDLPLGATEDRVAGALDIERALRDGEKAFEPGLLAQANRGFLYIDEINLLEDHLVDLLLDVAASGENLVEREGVSVRHPARFVLVGSGNPEEGELRPQLLDRFGLSVDVRTPTQLADRVEVVRRRSAFEDAPAVFADSYKRKDAALRRKVTKAREALASVELGDACLETAAELCMALGTDGLRGELTLTRAARARAALNGKAAATVDDLRAVAPMALRHRLRRDPLDEAGGDARVARAIAEVFDDADAG